MAVWRGVYVNGGTFEMSGGEISGNTATNSGGGVYVNGGTFTKGSGGIIYGSDAGALKNTTAAGFVYGHVAYVNGSKRRSLTAGTSDTLDSSKAGAEGGWIDIVPGSSLQAALTWLASNAEANGNYTIMVKADESSGPNSLSYSGKTVGITLTASAARTVSLSSTGSLFTVGSGVTLTLGSNVTLQGRSSNDPSLVQVNSGGTLVTESGSKITGNTGDHFNIASIGGGVNVASSGTFTMSGGEISGNTARFGGGVFVAGTFTMSGGEISGNEASDGGGVSVLGGTFEMSGGKISGNTDGGVYVYIGTFTKGTNGIIYGSNADAALKNTADGDGHAVFAYSANKKRNTTAGSGVSLNSGTSDNWE